MTEKECTTIENLVKSIQEAHDELAISTENHPLYAEVCNKLEADRIRNECGLFTIAAKIGQRDGLMSVLTRLQKYVSKQKK